MAELMKPCPFCGKTPKTCVVPNRNRITLKVFCQGPCVAAQYDNVDKCCTFDDLYNAMADVIYDWNKRSDNG